MPTLTISNLSAGYRQRPVLRGVSLEARAGEVVALAGPNGAGKSTLIRAISGVMPISAGAVRLDGLDLMRLSAAERARQLAVVPQAARLPGAFTVGEIVLMGRTPHLAWLGREGRADHLAVRAALERTDTLALAARRVDELSGGEQQRVLLARALAQAAPVLLLDEPTAHLDLRHQVDTLELVRDLARHDGLTVLAVLHDLNMAAEYADRVAVLDAGEVRAFGAPRQVFTVELLQAVYALPVRIWPHPEHGAPLVLPLSGKSS